jgi:hypothetical protein
LVKDAKTLRNQFVHLTDENEVMLFDGLSEALLIHTEGAITGWLNELSAALSMERHPNTQQIGRDLANALGRMTQEEYSAP